MNTDDPREQYARAFPFWMQPAITWISGKSMPRQVPLIPALCTPLAKLFSALLTVALGLAVGIDVWSVAT